MERVQKTFISEQYKGEEVPKEKRRIEKLKLELEAENKRCRRVVRVGDPEKVMCHLMFGILALTADQLLKFVA